MNEVRTRVPSWLLPVAAVALLPVTIAVAVTWPQLTLASTLLILLFEVVLVALAASMTVTVAAAVGAVLAANWFLTEPQHTFFVNDPSEIVELVVFVVTAVLAGVLVSRTVAAREAAARSRAETETYRAVMVTSARDSRPEPALQVILELLNLDEVELRDPANRTVARVVRSSQAADGAAPPTLGDASLEQDLPDRYLLLGSGPIVVAADQPLVASLGSAAVRLHQNRLLAYRRERS